MLLHLIVTSFVFLGFLNHGYAGITSRFIRSEWPSTDIPLDNKALAIPKGYNAPQQVEYFLYVFPFINFISILN